MSTSCLVLTALLLFFVQPVSGQSCTNIFNFCKTLLTLAPEFQVTDAPRSDCQTIEDHDKECNSYRKFWACMKSNMSACGKDSQTDTKIKRFQEKYSSRCYQETLCQLKVGKCNCLKLATYNTSESTADACKHLDLFENCISKITDCDHSTFVQNATAKIKHIKSFCHPECPDSFTCWTQLGQYFVSSSGSSSISIDNKQDCRMFKEFFHCLTKTCSATLSGKWLRVAKSYEAACTVYEDWTNSTSCSSPINCVQTFEVMSGITFQDTVTDKTIALANKEKLIAAFTNPGWWCRYVISTQKCFEQESNFCSLNSTKRKQAAALTATLDELCEDTDARPNCTEFLQSCNSSLKSDSQFAVKIHKSIRLVQCQVIESLETSCSFFQNLRTCVNNPLFIKFCEDDHEMSRELRSLQESYTDPCSKDTMCAVELVKCACTAHLLDAATMCKNINSYKDCAGTIKQCDKDTTEWQSLSITFKMTEGACKTECPGAFSCWMDAQDQVDYLFARLYSAVEELTNSCRILGARFQCLSRNTITCSDNLSHKWQQVVKSYEAVCLVFEQNTTKTSSCPSLRTCVYKVQLVPGVSVGDLKTLVTVSLSATDVGAAILTPGTWCRFLLHVVECMNQEDDTCLWTTAIKEKVAAANATVTGLCKECNNQSVDLDWQSGE